MLWVGLSERACRARRGACEARRGRRNPSGNYHPGFRGGRKLRATTPQCCARRDPDPTTIRSEGPLNSPSSEGPAIPGPSEQPRTRGPPEHRGGQQVPTRGTPWTSGGAGPRLFKGPRKLFKAVQGCSRLFKVVQGWAQGCSRLGARLFKARGAHDFQPTLSQNAGPRGCSRQPQSCSRQQQSCSRLLKVVQDCSRFAQDCSRVVHACAHQGTSCSKALCMIEGWARGVVQG